MSTQPQIVEGSTLALAPIDPRISYPSYKSFDNFIDTRRLAALDEYLTEKIRDHARLANDLRFYTGPFRLQESDPDRPGSRMIYLSESNQPDSYFDLDKTELWRPSSIASEFPMLLDFISTLPFSSTGRMLIMYDDQFRPVSPHRDHTDTNICHEFIWFRTNLRKPFYLLNPVTKEKQYVSSYSAWFDTVNQFHGSEPAEGLNFSIRVDGIFTDEFRKLIPQPPFNPASTPSFWQAVAKD